MPGHDTGPHTGPDIGADTRAATAIVLDPPGEVAGLPELTAPGGGRRALWTLADQALSSLTNAALSIVVAGAVGRADFGAFSLAVITFGFTVGFCRALVGEPFLVRFSAVEEATRAAGSARAAGAALVFGMLSGLACLVVALLTEGPTRTAFAALAMSLPGLVAQDTWRHVFFAAGRPAAATVNDLVWAVLQFAGLAVLLVTGSESVFLITLVWGTSATVAAVVGVVQTGVLPRPGSAWDWMVETRELNLQLGLGYVVNQGALQVGYYSVGGIVGVVGVGALRAAQVLLGPIGLLFAGFNSFMLPVLSRRVATGRKLLPVALPSSAGLAVVTTVWLSVLLVIPDGVGRRILGASWEGARQVMLPSGLVLVGLALVLGASNSLVAMSRSDLTLAITAVQAPLILVLGVFGAWQWGAVGAAWGFAVSQLVGLVIAWTYFLRVDGRPDEESVARLCGRHVA